MQFQPIIYYIIRITRSSYLKSNHHFRKTSIGQNTLSHIGPATLNRIPEILKKINNTLNTFKLNVKHYYLNLLLDPNFWHIGGFDYALSILMILFLFNEIFVHFLLVLLTLRDHNEKQGYSSYCFSSH